MNSNRNETNTGRKPDRKRFPAVALIILLLSLCVFVYSAVSVYVFTSSINSASEAAQGETATEVGGFGNIRFSTAEIFNIEDPSSTFGTIMLYLFCTLGVASVVVAVICCRKIVKSGASAAVKAILIIVGLIAGLLLGALATYKMYQFQLDWFKADKDASAGDVLGFKRDPNGVYYMLDGNGEPFLFLKLADDKATELQRTSVAQVLGVGSVDSLYVSCDYKMVNGAAGTDGEVMTIDGFNLDVGGKKAALDLTCVTKEGDDIPPIYYDLKVDAVTFRYELVTFSETDRSDVDSMTTFLILGKDRVALNTDVMILVSLKQEDGKCTANVLQLPRDTYCRDNSSNNKINAVYGSFYRDSDGATESEKIRDGMEGLKSVLERNLLIKIDYWAIMNLDGFGDIVDAIGGVDMYVPFNMRYYDPTANPPLNINLKAGQQTLYGDEAEQYIRYRKGYVQGDIGRVDATKVFLTAFFVKLRSELSITNPTALASTVSTLMTYVNTNLDAGNAVSYVKEVLDLTLEDINFLNLPGGDGATDQSGLSFYTSNLDGTYYVLNKYFNVYDTDIDKSAFDVSRMFTTAASGTPIDNLHNKPFDPEEYDNGIRGADDIKSDNDQGISTIPTVG